MSTACTALSAAANSPRPTPPATAASSASATRPPAAAHPTTGPTFAPSAATPSPPIANTAPPATAAKHAKKQRPKDATESRRNNVKPKLLAFRNHPEWLAAWMIAAEKPTARYPTLDPPPAHLIRKHGGHPPHLPRLLGHRPLRRMPRPLPPILSHRLRRRHLRLPRRPGPPRRLPRRPGRIRTIGL